MTNNQKAHLQAIGTILASILVAVFTIIMVKVFPQQTFGLVFLVFMSTVIYHVYVTLFNKFKKQGK